MHTPTPSPLSIFGKTPLERVANAIQAFKESKPVILLDDENRENEGDIIFPADVTTPELVNLLIRNCSGIICLCLSENLTEKLKLPMMVDHNTSTYQTGFTVSIEAKNGVSTGVSAKDRAHTILTAVSPEVQPQDLARPGHVFPLKARKGGVLQRAGHTEGSVDLAMLAGYSPAAVLCELMNSDGTMARQAEVIAFCKERSLMALTIEDIITYRKNNL